MSLPYPNDVREEAWKRLAEQGITELIPCPFCGESEPMRKNKSGRTIGLYNGHCDAMSFAVECYTCSSRGAKIDLEDPRIGKIEDTDEMEGSDWMFEIEVRCLILAIKQWNKRSGK